MIIWKRAMKCRRSVIGSSRCRRFIFCRTLPAWQKQYQPQKTTVQITTEAGIYQLALQDIIYVEIVGRKVQLVTTQGTLHSTEPMQHWEQRLPASQFLTPYNKILVNLAHVKFFEPDKTDQPPAIINCPSPAASISSLKMPC